MEKPAEYDTVTINYPVDLRLVAECVGSTPTELQDLNPSLLRMTTPRVGKFELHLPAGTKDDYETAIASIPTDMRLWWRYHTVHPGDTLASLARNYHTTAKSIIAANHLDATELDADAKLVIPVTPGKHPHERHCHVRPPHHSLSRSCRGHSRKRRRQLRNLAANVAPLEWHSRR